MKQEQGFLEQTNVLLSSKKLKKFKYDENCLKNNPIDEFDVYIKIEATPFYKFIKFLNKVEANSVIFEADKNNRYFKLSYEKELINIETLYPIEENAKCKYSIEYLINILREYKIKEIREEFIEFWFSTDFPLKIKFGGDWFLLAPMVEKD